MGFTGDPDDAPGGGRRRLGIAVADQMTVLYADVAIPAALRERDRSGPGQYINMALLDVQVANLTNLGRATPPRAGCRAGNRLATVCRSDSFRCADRDLMIIVGNDAQIRSFCAALGMPDLASDARFARHADRLRHAGVLARLLGEALRDQTLADCQALFDAAGVPAGPINTRVRVFADPQVVARGVVQESRARMGPRSG